MISARMRATSTGSHRMTISPSAAIAAASGNMLWHIAIPFALGSLTGMLVGRRFARRIPGARIQQVFAVFALGVSVSMFIKAVGM